MDETINKKKILIIKLTAYNNLSSANIRMLALIKGFSELGYETDLLCCPVSAVDTANDMSEYTFLDHVNIIETSANASYEKLVTSQGGLKKKLLPYMRKVYHKISIYDSSKSIADGIRLNILPEKEYGLVISISDPKTSHIALMNLLNQGLKCKKVIEYWGDPFYGDITQKSILPKFVLKAKERKLISLANKIVYTSPFTLALEQKTYPAFADRMFFYPTANIDRKIFDDTGNEVFTVGYYGAYKSAVRNLIPLYNAFGRLEGTAKLNIAGDSDIVLKETDNITIIPRGIVTELEKKTDLFVCVLNRHGTQVPGKLYYLATSNRPVLVIVDGDSKKEMTDFLSGFHRFIVCDNNENDICDAIHRVISDDVIAKPCEMLSPISLARNMLKE